MKTCTSSAVQLAYADITPKCEHHLAAQPLIGLVLVPEVDMPSISLPFESMPRIWHSDEENPFRKMFKDQKDPTKLLSDMPRFGKDAAVGEQS